MDVNDKDSYVGVSFSTKSDSKIRCAVFQRSGESLALKSGDIVDIAKLYGSDFDGLLSPKSKSKQIKLNLKYEN